MSVAWDYINAHDGYVDEAAEAFARDLMCGDPDNFKAGYSAPNAYLATVEVFGLRPHQAANLRNALQDHEAGSVRLDMLAYLTLALVPVSLGAWCLSMLAGAVAGVA